MVLHVIGLGLGDCEDITVKGLNRVRSADRVFLECYTSVLGVDKNDLEKFYGKPIIEADRTMVEERSDEILEGAVNGSVAFLVVGDPLTATTHADLILRARERGVDVKIVHNASILTAAASCGLQLYNFGETVSIPFWTDDWRPESFFYKISSNFRRNQHTLCLLDIKVKERTVENMMRGKEIYEPPQFMTAAQGAQQLVEIIKQQEKDWPEKLCEEPVVRLDSKAVALCRMGKDSQRIVTCSLKEMASRTDLGPPLHSLVIAAPKLHELEEDFLKQFRTQSNGDS